MIITYVAGHVINKYALELQKTYEEPDGKIKLIVIAAILVGFSVCASFRNPYLY